MCGETVILSWIQNKRLWFYSVIALLSGCATHPQPDVTHALATENKTSSASESVQTSPDAQPDAPPPLHDPSLLARDDRKDAETEKPATEKIADSENPVPPLPPSDDSPAPLSPFVDVVSLDTQAILLSSVHHLDTRVLGINTINGGSFLLDARDIQSPHVIELSPKAQVACTMQWENKYYLALIERDTANAGFRLDVRTMTSPTDVENAELWKVKTRGFQPNPGSGCAFVESRKLVVEGTRLRDGKVPYHGIFTVTPHKLELWPDFGIHVPHVVAAFTTSSSRNILLRGVVVDENGKGELRDRLYEMKLQETEAQPGVYQSTADHLYFAGAQRFALQNDGACIETSSGTTCPNAPDRIESILWIEPSGADIRFGSGKHGFAKNIADYPSLLELPQTEVVLADLGDGYYLLASQNDLRQDVGTQLRIAKLQTR